MFSLDALLLTRSAIIFFLVTVFAGRTDLQTKVEGHGELGRIPVGRQ